MRIWYSLLIHGPMPASLLSLRRSQEVDRKGDRRQHKDTDYPQKYCTLRIRQMIVDRYFWLHTDIAEPVKQRQAKILYNPHSLQVQRMDVCPCTFAGVHVCVCVPIA